MRKRGDFPAESRATLVLAPRTEEVPATVFGGVPGPVGGGDRVRPDSPASHPRPLHVAVDGGRPGDAGWPIQGSSDLKNWTAAGSARRTSRTLAPRPSWART